MSGKLKKIIAILGAVALVAVATVWFMSSDLKHIEDTNGADNYSLQTITDSNIINRDVGAMGLNIHKSAVSDVTTYSSEKFTGVEEIYGTNIWGNRLEITVNHARVDSGNFKIVLQACISYTICIIISLNLILRHHHISTRGGGIFKA